MDCASINKNGLGHSQKRIAADYVRVALLKDQVSQDLGAVVVVFVRTLHEAPAVDVTNVPAWGYMGDPRSADPRHTLVSRWLGHNLHRYPS
jgi:hypothetical protein